MSLGFTADELFAIAVQVERNGTDFYRKAAKLVKAKATSATLRKLAEAEVGHEKTFTEMRDRLTEDEREPMIFDPHGEAAAYLQTFADKNVFDTSIRPADILTGEESPRALLKLALALEKDSIVLYLGLRNAMLNKKSRESLDAVLNEEMKHVVILSKELHGLDD